MGLFQGTTLFHPSILYHYTLQKENLEEFPERQLCHPDSNAACGVNNVYTTLTTRVSTAGLPIQ